MPTNSQSNTSIIGLSGPSSSGKTTLARLLREIFNIDATDGDGVTIKLFIVHEDDFYKTDTDIPTRTVTSSTHGTREIQDWDCVESLNLPLLTTTINHVKTYGNLPPDMISKEDQNTVGEVGVSDTEIQTHKTNVTDWLKTISSDDNDTTPKQITLCILDGFLLYPPPPTYLTQHLTRFTTTSPSLLTELHAILLPTLDLKLFLPATKHQTVTRRARRSGYVTMEGFWADPPGFVEDVVWPNYVRDHSWLFGGREGDADEGRVERDGEWVRGEGIVVGPGTGEVEMREVLGWGVKVVMGLIGGVLGVEKEG